MMPLNLPHGERFLPYEEQNLSPCGNLSRTCTGLGVKRGTLYFLTIENEIEIFKILNSAADH
jgi:hypothetical protein